MQEVQWRRPYVSSVDPAAGETVKRMAFSFVDDQLSRIVVDYDSDLTAGMTNADLTEALSAQYGPVSGRDAVASGRLPSQLEQESGAVVARWAGAGFVAVAYRLSYDSGFRLIVSDPRLASLARTAEAQAIRLERLDEPRRESARRKLEEADVKARLDKARLANKAAFRP
jgi:hypothetical protein